MSSKEQFTLPSPSEEPASGRRDRTSISIEHFADFIAQGPLEISIARGKLERVGQTAASPSELALAEERGDDLWQREQDISFQKEILDGLLARRPDGSRLDPEKDEHLFMKIWALETWRQLVNSLWERRRARVEKIVGQADQSSTNVRLVSAGQDEAPPTRRSPGSFQEAA